MNPRRDDVEYFDTKFVLTPVVRKILGMKDSVQYVVVGQRRIALSIISRISIITTSSMLTAEGRTYAGDINAFSPAHDRHHRISELKCLVVVALVLVET